ncbi:MAG: hemerythrin [Pirellulaceae bacterium]|jgi:hemerythrin
MSNQAENQELLQEIRNEHKALRELLGATSRTLTKGKESVGDVSEMLVSLRNQLEQHFQNEEAVGFFDKIAAEAPRLAEKTQHIHKEHAKLIKTLKELAAFVTERSNWWDETERRFQEFSRELGHHESTETELLMDAYMRDIGMGE